MVQAIDKADINFDKAKTREIKYDYSNSFSNILQNLKISLFFSTYQAGQLGIVTAKNGSLKIDFHNFERAMGMAIDPTKMAVGSKDWVYLLKNDPVLAPQIEPPGTYDTCFLSRRAQYTGDISIHDLAWGNNELWIVNTRFSCLCTLTDNYNFLPQWRPNFVSAIAAEDRCHLNGMAMVNGMPKYVTVLGKTNTPGGWRDNKISGGCILEVPSSRIITEGLAMPHSPRMYQNRLWVLNSGYGELITVDVATGRQEKIASLPGYTRGLAIFGNYAFIGLSQVREKDVFSDLPIQNNLQDEIKCGIAICDLSVRQLVGCLEFSEAIEEIFDVQIAPVSSVMVNGPHVAKDNTEQIWSLPASAAT
jgi:uncharacterized protein (TIGR03032 family)